MTLPRPVLPGQTVMFTRRCAQRQLLLRPSATINQILLYCLAVAAERYGIVVHAFCFLSNHYHVVATDLRGMRPEFCRWFHEFSAKCINAHHGRWENLWASEPPSVVELVDGTAQLDKVLYTLANPVQAGLVACAHQWPGVHSQPEDIGRSITVCRPRGFFRDSGPLPEVATLRVTKLPALAHLSEEAYAAQLHEAVAAREAELQAQLRAGGRSFMGRRNVLDQSPFDVPQTHEPRRELSPRVACRSKWARIEALQRLKAFVDAYREAWRAYREGRRDTLFPCGTYWLRLHAAVPCAAPG
jgi:REP element-mobilizing transposase RayT